MKKTFRHALQLAQLKRLDPSAHKAASVALRGGFAAIASQIIVKAMQAALTRLVTVSPAPLPPCSPALPFPARFDLIIATRKVAKFAGHVQSSDGKITWWKQAGQEKVNLKGTLRLTDTTIAMKLFIAEHLPQYHPNPPASLAPRLTYADSDIFASIEAEELLNIWKRFMEDGTYYRPDVLAAIVADAVSHYLDDFYSDLEGEIFSDRGVLCCRFDESERSVRMDLKRKAR